MATLAGNFDLLPNELILHIAFMLPVTDVIAFKGASYLSLPILQSRIQPSGYLQSRGPFSNTENLFKVMAAYNAVLSGSRALDYFIPGSTTKSSDWDFYVPSTPSSIMAVKMALEHSGFEFQSCLSRVVNIIRKESDSSEHEENNSQDESSSEPGQPSLQKDTAGDAKIDDLSKSLAVL